MGTNLCHSLSCFQWAYYQNSRVWPSAFDMLLLFLYSNSKVEIQLPNLPVCFLGTWLKKTREAQLFLQIPKQWFLGWLLLEVEIYLNPRANSTPTCTLFHRFVTVVLKMAPAKESVLVYKWNLLYIHFIFTVFLFRGDIFNSYSTGDFVLYSAFLGTLVYNLHIHDL